MSLTVSLVFVSVCMHGCIYNMLCVCMYMCACVHAHFCLNLENLDYAKRIKSTLQNLILSFK